jgi:hypothetical protein
LAGSYTASFSRSNAPATEGTGFALITNSPNGTVTIRTPSALQDGTLIAKPSVLAENGKSPLYIPLYGNNGVLVGWLNFSNGSARNIAGDLTWIKPAVPGSPLFSSGITSAVGVVGSLYQRPTTSASPLSASNFNFALSGGDLNSALSLNMRLRTNTFSVVPPSVYNPALQIDPATGELKGSVTINGTSHVVHGAVFQNGTNGSGFFLSPSKAGAVKLSPQ